MDVRSLRRLQQPGAFAPLVLGLVLVYPTAVLLDWSGSSLVRGELGVIELTGAAGFLVAAIAFGALAFHSVGDGNTVFGRRTQRNLVVGSLSALMFVCAGEELSWGQHLIGFETPEAVAAVNAQGEFNLHNLRSFHQFRPDGSRKGWLESTLSMNRLFSIFWFVSFVALPLADRSVEKLRRWLDGIGVPVPPLWVGAMFLAAYVSYKASHAIAGPAGYAHVLQETKETSYALIYAVFAVTWLLAARGQRRR